MCSYADPEEEPEDEDEDEDSFQELLTGHKQNTSQYNACVLVTRTMCSGQ